MIKIKNIKKYRQVTYLTIYSCMYFILKNQQNQDIRKTFLSKEIENIENLQSIDFKGKSRK